MALAIDSRFLAGDYFCWLTGYLNFLVGSANRFYPYRICAHATVVNDAQLLDQILGETEADLAEREALNWQADQDYDVPEMQVLQFLDQQAQTSPLLRKHSLQTERKDVTTTLMTSCTVQSPSLPAGAHGRPLSSFHRYSLRQSMLGYFLLRPNPCRDMSNVRELIPSVPDSRPIHFPLPCEIVGACSRSFVVWQLQVDIVDLLSPRSPGKRRRTTLNPFHQVSSPPVQESSPANHLPQAKRFRGVRYRSDRKTWAAEMKPPKHKSKVTFGEFKSEAQATRAIDAAYYYYDRLHLLNFPDTPAILSTKPLPAGELDEKDKQRFVKVQAKWLASIASTLPSSPPRVPFEIPMSSSKGCAAGPSGFGSISALASFRSCGGGDEADDGISQARLSSQGVPTGGLLSNCLMEPNLVGADGVSAIFPSEEQQNMFQWNSENALVDPCLSAQWSPSTSVQITDGWDGAEHSVAPILTNPLNSTQPSFDSQGLWENHLGMSPQASMIPMPSSPWNFGSDTAPSLLEQQSFDGEWISGSSAAMNNAWNSSLRD